MRLSIALKSLPIFLLSLGVSAQHTPAWPTSPADCVVDGQVVNSITKLPVPGAVVTIYNKHAFRTNDGTIAITDTSIRRPEAAPQDDPRSVTTDEDGQFSFTAVEPGIYVMAAAKESFLRTPYNPYNPTSGGTIQLEPGGAAHGLVIRLRPESVVTGHLRDAGGAPVRGATVALSQYVVGQQGRQLVTRMSGPTNDRGEYKLSGFDADKYYVRAVATGAPMVFYPNSLTPEGARQIDITEGNQVNDIDIVIPPHRGATIQGTIAAVDGLTPMSVTATSREFGTMLGTLSPATHGRDAFEIAGLRPGDYWLHALAVKDGRSYDTWTQIVVDEKGRSGIELQPAPPADIHGRIEVDGMAGVKLSGLRLALDNSYSVDYQGIPIPVKEDGTFSMSGIPAAVYRITPLYTSSAFLRGMRLGDADITEKGLDLTHGSPPGELTVLLSAGGSIRGIVRDESGNGAAGALIALLPLDRPTDPQRARELSKLTFPDTHGAYAFIGVPPGSYRLFAWKNGIADGKTVLYNADYVKPFEAQSRTIEIAPNARQTVDLQAMR